MLLQVQDRKGKTLVADGLKFHTYKGAPTVNDLMQSYWAISKKTDPTRQRWTLPLQEGQKKATVLASGKKLSDYGIKDGDTLIFKDLGPQIGYATVFFWEYFGPMVIFPLMYLCREVVYGVAFQPQPIQTYATIFWFAHYAKRILETWFVHNFSHGTMPIANLFRNCGYYWTFAAWCGYFVCHPKYTAVGQTQQYVGLALGVAMELSNLYCHLILANLRKPGVTGYQIPRGFLFDFPGITCANYFAEIMAWFGFNIATQSVAGYTFMVCGGGQMVEWAIAKHKRLRRQFDGKEGREKYPRRWIIMPPFL